MILILLLYIGSYTILSLQGEYVELICGGSDGSEHWYPLWCRNNKTGTGLPYGRIKTDQPSAFGFLYLPLLTIDQRYIHKSKPGIWEYMKNEQAHSNRFHGLST